MPASAQTQTQADEAKKSKPRRRRAPTKVRSTAMPINAAPQGDPSDDTLDRVVVRSMRFLLAVGTDIVARAAIESRGYSDAEHARGWSLVDRVSGRTSMTPPPMGEGSTTRTARDAIEQWLVANLPIAEASLQYGFSAQHAFVFRDDLKTGGGAAAVITAQAFLSRVNALGSAKRGEHRASDERALAQLERRGIGTAQRSWLAEQIALVQRGDKPGVVSTSPISADRANRLALYAWHAEWSAIARTVIKQRGLLIRMGLATRRKAEKKPATP
jgi:hypothetical protein